MLRKILKVKITKDEKADVVWESISQEEGVANDVDSREGGNKIHPDFQSAMDDIKIHFAAICEQYAYTELEDDNNLDKEDQKLLPAFMVTGITVGGEGEHEGITISGQRHLKDNRVLNLNTPFVKLDPEHSHYPYVASLSEAISKAFTEADLYLNGKYAPDNQLALFPDGEELEGVEAKPKGKRSRPKKEKIEEPTEA